MPNRLELSNSLFFVYSQKNCLLLKKLNSILATFIENLSLCSTSRNLKGSGTNFAVEKKQVLPVEFCVFLLVFTHEFLLNIPNQKVYYVKN